MKILLRDDVEKLGRLGDIVEVAEGYARNYLLPRQLAVRATRDNEALIVKIKKHRAEREAARRQVFAEKAEELRGKSTTITTRVNEEGKLYGSVDAALIAAAISRDLAYDVSAGQVQLPEPIKELGTHDVTVSLHPDVTTTIKLYVVAEE